MVNDSAMSRFPIEVQRIIYIESSCEFLLLIQHRITDLNQKETQTMFLLQQFP